jgi:hypothetical protein
MKLEKTEKIEADQMASNAGMPSSFKNVEEIRFYVRDLCFKIEELENIFDYVPASSYNLLAKYHTLQDSSTEKRFNTIL